MSYYIIGIDPGTITLGVAIFKMSNTDKILSIQTKLVKSPASRKLPVRMMDIGDELYDIFDEYNPKILCVETPFIHIRRINAVIPLARMFQNILTMCHVANKKNGIKTECFPVAPLQAKRAVEGNMRSDKDAMRLLVSKHPVLRKYIPKLETMSEHEVDGIAIAWHKIKEFKCFL